MSTIDAARSVCPFVAAGVLLASCGAARADEPVRLGDPGRRFSAPRLLQDAAPIAASSGAGSLAAIVGVTGQSVRVWPEHGTACELDARPVGRATCLALAEDGRVLAVGGTKGVLGLATALARAARARRAPRAGGGRRGRGRAGRVAVGRPAGPAGVVGPAGPRGRRARGNGAHTPGGAPAFSVELGAYAVLTPLAFDPGGGVVVLASGQRAVALTLRGAKPVLEVRAPASILCAAAARGRVILGLADGTSLVVRRCTPGAVGSAPSRGRP